jgi:UDP-N-acetylmuramate--alanine ligase
VLIFQPHRYTRTRDLFEDFVEVLSAPDLLVLLDVYTAGEAPIQGADARSLSRAIRLRGEVDPVFVADASDLPKVCSLLLRADDLVMTMGAGNVGQIADELPEKLAKTMNVEVVRLNG